MSPKFSISPTYRNRIDNYYVQRTSDVARLATKFQREYPEMTRTEALKEAENSLPYFV